MALSFPASISCVRWHSSVSFLPHLILLLEDPAFTLSLRVPGRVLHESQPIYSKCFMRCCIVQLQIDMCCTVRPSTIAGETGGKHSRGPADDADQKPPPPPPPRGKPVGRAPIFEPPGMIMIEASALPNTDHADGKKCWVSQCLKGHACSMPASMQKLLWHMKNDVASIYKPSGNVFFFHAAKRS